MISLATGVALTSNFLRTTGNIVVPPVVGSLNFIYGPDPAYVGPTAGDFVITTADNIQATITAANAAGGSQTIVMRGGRYRQQAALTGVTADIEFARYGNEEVIVTAAEPLTGWVQCTVGDQGEVGANFASIYKTDITLSNLDHGEISLLNLHEDDVRCNIAMDRVTDESAFAYAWVDDATAHLGSFTVNGGNIEAITDATVLNKYTAAQAADLVVGFYNGDNRMTLSSFSSFDQGTSTGTLTDQSKAEHANGASSHLYTLINSTLSLKQGRWACRNNGDGTGTVYFWPNDTANLAANIEYTTREYVFDLGDTTGDTTFRGLDVVRPAGVGTADGICIGSVTVPADTKPGSLTVENCNLGQTGGDSSYSPLFPANIKGGVRIANTKLFETNGIGLYTLDCPDTEITQCQHIDHGKNAIRCFEGQGWVWSFSEFDRVARDTHANLGSIYEHTDSSLIWGVKGRNGFGYLTTSQASNMTIAFSDLQVNNLVGDDRAFANQNREAGSGLVDKDGNPSADGSGTTVAGTRMVMFNNATRPINAADAPNSVSHGNLAIGASAEDWTQRNNLYYGMSDAPEAVDDRAANVFSGVGADQLAKLPIDGELFQPALEMYLDPFNGDYSLRPDNIVEGRTGDDISDLIAIVQGRHPTFADYLYDMDGTVFSPTSPPVGPQVAPALAPAETINPVAPVDMSSSIWFDLEAAQGWEATETFVLAIRMEETAASGRTWLFTNALNTYFAFEGNGNARIRIQQEDGTDVFPLDAAVSIPADANDEYSIIMAVSSARAEVWVNGSLVVDVARPSVEPMRTPTVINATAADTGADATDVRIAAVWSSFGDVDAATAAAALFDPTTYAPTQAMLDGDPIGTAEATFFENRALDWPDRVGWTTPSNSAPVAVADTVTTAYETAVTYDVLANDTDADMDTLTVTAASVTSGGGAVVNNNDGTLTYTPAAGYDGQAVVSYTVSDGTATDDGTLTITVEPEAAETDLMSGIGDFSSAVGWTLDADLSIAGGQLSSAAPGNFSNAARSGANRIPATPGQVVSLELDVAVRTTTTTIRVRLRAYDAGGIALETALLVMNSPSVTFGVGTNRYDDIYTVPASTATLNVDIEYTIGPSDTVFDAIRLMV